MNNERITELPGFNYQSESPPLNSWMRDIPVIDNLSLGELVLPGAHNAGIDSAASYPTAELKNWLVCQTDSFLYQLNRGARALDLRLECERGRDGSSYFWFQHGGLCSSRSLADLIANTLEFLDQNPDEFIVFDFHELKAGNRMFDYETFNRLMVKHLGERMIPGKNLHLPLGQLKALSGRQRLLVCAPNHPALDKNHFNRQIQHKWSGSNLTDVGELFAHITKVMKNPPGGAMPWSLSATCYDALWGPMPIGGPLDQWFDPAISDWPQKSSIINVDFLERSNLVMNCRAANIINANARTSAS
ncbi:MAG: Phospholipase [Pseudomonas sp.]|nr:Phospholipase [Pseudomonas sp.]